MASTTKSNSRGCLGIYGMVVINSNAVAGFRLATAGVDEIMILLSMQKVGTGEIYILRPVSHRRAPNGDAKKSSAIYYASSLAYNPDVRFSTAR
jgi:hypothetical protein